MTDVDVYRDEAAFERHALLSARNLGNLALALLAPVPFVAMVGVGYGGTNEPVCESIAASAGCWSWLILEHPVVAVFLALFANVCVGFWLVSLVQRSVWLIDLYWTIIPLLAAGAYALHPAAEANAVRSWAALGVLGLWSGRLTYNYLRRERFRFGLREDWRFGQMRRESPHFWWTSFFVAYLLQLFMLVGLTLPLWAVHAHAPPFGAVDALLVGLAFTGIAVAHVADTQLHAFMGENAARVARGEPKQLVLDAGLWRWSRHPNYFGEQLFWWALAGLGAWVGEPWVVVGTVFNSSIMVAVTRQVEQRMLADANRAAAFEEYRRRTSAWVPWPKRGVRR